MVRWRQLLRLSSLGRWRFSVAFAGWVPVSAFQRGVVRQHWRRSRNWRSPRVFCRLGLTALRLLGRVLPELAGLGRMKANSNVLPIARVCGVPITAGSVSHLDVFLPA